jgi:hypothetical protein
MVRCNGDWPKGPSLYTLRIHAFHRDDMTRRSSTSDLRSQMGSQIGSPGVQIRGRDPDRTPQNGPFWECREGPHPGSDEDGQWELHAVGPGGHHCVYYVPRVLASLV